MRRNLITPAATAAVIFGLSAALIPVRGSLSIATVGLILVVPVVAAVVVGGFGAGVVAVASGFVAWDLFFIPPYYRLSVGSGQNWIALLVYAVVMLLVAQVVSRLQSARTDAQARVQEEHRLFQLSQLLVGDRSLPELLTTIVDAVQSAFRASGVALLLPRNQGLEVVAAAGEALELSDLESPGAANRPPGAANRPVALGTVPGATASLRTVALAASGRPVGVLALSGGLRGKADSVLLQTFANHAALAVERAQLQTQALRTQVLEEVDLLRRALLGSVSHDLRTPLATMKVAASTLINDLDEAATADDTRELCELLDSEIDHLTRLVTGLLDLSRYQAGILKIGVEPCSALDLVTDAVARMRPSLGDRIVKVCVPDDLPQLNVDAVLVGQVIVNLIDNAHRHAPSGTSLTVDAAPSRTDVKVSVVDSGPGVPATEREHIFDGLVRDGRAGRAGMGLWICRAFIEAHGGRIWVDPSFGPGTKISFTVPCIRASRPLTRVG